ncbi:MAG TPA: tellurite resistance/C4-dicarboxylate transporter family protein [Woeseiaceae bacterium]|nr:tellurite resistance/C4-dicarboxylate transporter family protein [Woeseiaceae bacterium]
MPPPARSFSNGVAASADLPRPMPGGRLARGAAGLFPGYFAFVMATGALSVAAHLLSVSWLAWALLVTGSIAYLLLWSLTLVRVFRFPARLVADMHDHTRGPGFFTLIAGTSILGTQYLVIADSVLPARLLWILAVALWVAVTYWFLTAVTVREAKPRLGKGINGAWLLVSVATHSVAILTSLLPWSDAALPAAHFFAVCMYFVGCMLYLAIVPLIFYRLTFVRLPIASLTPPYWINMGAAAIATLAGSTLILVAPPGSSMSDFLPFVKGFTLFSWAAATWWIPLLLGLTIWRHGVARYPLSYDPQLWSVVFPLAMYTSATLRLVEALDLGFLSAIPAAFMVVALAAWTGTAAAMLLHLVRSLNSRSVS